MAPSGGVAARADTNTSSKAAMKWNEMLPNWEPGLLRLYFLPVEFCVCARIFFFYDFRFAGSNYSDSNWVMGRQVHGCIEGTDDLEVPHRDCFRSYKEIKTAFR